MLKLFKAKSLKENTEQSAGVGACAQGAGAGVGACAQSVEVGAGVGICADLSAGTNNKNAKKQRGRSMVEMLGVLAIIGVLSIGGIQGYTIAMRRYRANEILNFINKYVLTIYTQCQTGMMNDPEHYYIVENCYDDGKNCWNCGGEKYYSWSYNLKLSDAGLGTPPTGLLGIGEWGFKIQTLDSGDVVTMDILLNDKALCETITTIIGRDVKQNDYYNCNKRSTGCPTAECYGVNYISFMMN